MAVDYKLVKGLSFNCYLVKKCVSLALLIQMHSFILQLGVGGRVG